MHFASKLSVVFEYHPIFFFNIGVPKELCETFNSGSCLMVGSKAELGHVGILIANYKYAYNSQYTEWPDYY